MYNYHTKRIHAHGSKLRAAKEPAGGRKRRQLQCMGRLPCLATRPACCLLAAGDSAHHKGCAQRRPHTSEIGSPPGSWDLPPAAPWCRSWACCPAAASPTAGYKHGMPCNQWGAIPTAHALHRQTTQRRGQGMAAREELAHSARPQGAPLLCQHRCNRMAACAAVFCTATMHMERTHPGWWGQQASEACAAAAAAASSSTTSSSLLQAQLSSVLTAVEYSLPSRWGWPSECNLQGWGVLCPARPTCCCGRACRRGQLPQTACVHCTLQDAASRPDSVASSRHAPPPGSYKQSAATFMPQQG